MKKIILVAAIALSACSQPASKLVMLANQQQNSIINGTPVTSDSKYAKSVVGLLMRFDITGDGNKVWFSGCTGSILNDKFILTASHCLRDMNTQDLMINFSLGTLSNDKQSNPGSRVTDIEKLFVTRKVKAFKMHPEYRGPGNHDVAVIELESAIPADHVAVELLPDQYINKAKNNTSFDLLPNQKVTLVGFGLISESPQKDTEVLRMTTLPARFENQFVVTDQTHGTGGCNGDSGGPAFYDVNGKTYQVGVTHGPHGQSTTCAQEGEWMNPALEKEFIADAQKKMLENQ